MEDNNVKENEKKESEISVVKELFEYIKLVAIVVIAMIALQKFVLINAQIPSESMENNVMAGDRIFGNRLAYINSDPKRFDVVISNSRMTKASILSNGSSVCRVRPLM